MEVLQEEFQVLFAEILGKSLSYMMTQIHSLVEGVSHASPIAISYHFLGGMALIRGIAV